jgi:anti-sigma regulatory factor (Ser/Thr protein kinase)
MFTPLMDETELGLGKRPVARINLDKAIQGFEYKVNSERKEDKKDFFIRHFQREIEELKDPKHGDALERIVERIESSYKLNCFIFRTDSSNAGAYAIFFNAVLEKNILAAGFDEDKAFHFNICLAEAYANSVFHGNKGGDVKTYRFKEMTMPQEIKKNLGKPVLIESVLGDKVYIQRITDLGKGFGSCDDIKMGKGGKCLTTSGRGLGIIKSWMDDMVAYQHYPDEPEKPGFTLTTFAYK